jgi:hypothetical protein
MVYIIYKIVIESDPNLLIGNFINLK